MLTASQSYTNTSPSLHRRHAQLRITSRNLGGVLQALVDYARAKAASERVLAISEKHLPGDHPNIQIVRGNLVQLEEESERVEYYLSIGGKPALF